MEFAGAVLGPGCLARCVQDRGPDSADTRGVHTGAVLGQGIHARNDRCWDGPDSAETVESPQLALTFGQGCRRARVGRRGV